MSPVPALKVIDWWPSMVLEAPKLISPPPELELMDTGPVRVIALAAEKTISPVVAAMLLPKRTDPEPFCVNVPAELNVFPIVVVNTPELVRVIPPVPVAVALPRKVNWAPVKLMPPEPLVVRLASNEVNPVPAVCTKEAAFTAFLARKFPTVVIVRAPRGAMDPALRSKVMSPDPEESVRLPGPSMVLKKRMGWLAACVLNEAVPTVATDPVN